MDAPLLVILWSSDSVMVPIALKTKANGRICGWFYYLIITSLDPFMILSLIDRHMYWQSKLPEGRIAFLDLVWS